MPFATQIVLLEHFEGHKSEFGFVTADQYLAAAEAFLFGALDGNTFECIRPQGGFTRYNQVTEEYGAVTARGFICTYMIPDPKRHGYATNLDYYHAKCQ